MASCDEDKENTPPIMGSGNFLADRGYEDPEEMKLKFLLANEVALIVDELDLTPARVAEMTRLSERDVSRVVNGLVEDYSVYRLMRILNALGKDIVIAFADSEHEHGIILAGMGKGAREGLGPRA